MKITNECVVAIHYTLTNAQGQQLDSSQGSDPLQYLHGVNGLIPGLERELDGRQVGDAFTAVIAPTDAYGEVDPRLIREVPLEALSEIENLAVGMKLQSRSSDGHVQVIVVDAVGPETATLNGNHELAGTTLHFDVVIDSVREATPEELEHGHAH
jgi:FKBP-type peptidyl-prolyl cis-trans isomerase SlyD